MIVMTTVSSNRCHMCGRVGGVEQQQKKKLVRTVVFRQSHHMFLWALVSLTAIIVGAEAGVRITAANKVTSCPVADVTVADQRGRDQASMSEGCIEVRRRRVLGSMHG